MSKMRHTKTCQKECWTNIQTKNKKLFTVKEQMASSQKTKNVLLFFLPVYRNNAQPFEQGTNFKLNISALHSKRSVIKIQFVTICFLLFCFSIYLKNGFFIAIKMIFKQSLDEAFSCSSWPIISLKSCMLLDFFRSLWRNEFQFLFSSAWHDSLFYLNSLSFKMYF